MMLRSARSTDAGKTGAILSEFIDTTSWMPRIHTRAEDIGFCGKMIEAGEVTVAEVDHAVAGFLTLHQGEVHCLYVSGSKQGQGIGKALLDHAKNGASRLELWTFQANDGARRFYKREGFAEVETTDGSGNDEQLPDVRLVWERTTQ